MSLVDLPRQPYCRQNRHVLEDGTEEMQPELGRPDGYYNVVEQDQERGRFARCLFIAVSFGSLKRGRFALTDIEPIRTADGLSLPEC